MHVSIAPDFTTTLFVGKGVMNSQANMSSWVSLSDGSFFLGVLREGVIIDTRVVVSRAEGEHR